MNKQAIRPLSPQPHSPRQSADIVWVVGLIGVIRTTARVLRAGALDTGALDAEAIQAALRDLATDDDVLKLLEAANTAAGKQTLPRVSVCLWDCDDDDTGAWSTTCERCVSLMDDGTPADNRFIYYPNCGGQIVEHAEEPER